MSITGLQAQVNRMRDYTPGSGAICLARAHTNQVRTYQSLINTDTWYLWDVLDYEFEPGTIFTAPDKFTLPADGAYLFTANLGLSVNATSGHPGGGGGLVELYGWVRKVFYEGSLGILGERVVTGITYTDSGGTPQTTNQCFNYYPLETIRPAHKGDIVKARWGLTPGASGWIAWTGPDSEIAIYLLPDPI